MLSPWEPNYNQFTRIRVFGLKDSAIWGRQTPLTQNRECIFPWTDIMGTIDMME